MKPVSLFAFLLVSSIFKASGQDVKSDTTTLKTVTVTATKNPFTYKNGNLQVNVENSVLSSIPDAIELLSKVPTVLVSRDGETISIVGKGEPIIYIDQQKVSVNDLKSLSVADIKSIELINNPSAKFEANGRTVILVTRKINTAEGIKAELSETAAYRKYYLNRASANVSVRKKKMELKGNIQFNELKTWEGNDFDFRINNRHIFSGYKVTAVTSRQPQFIGGGGFFYQWNEQDYLSVSTNFRTVTEKFPIYTNSTLSDDSRNESVFTDNVNRQPKLYHSSNINYNKNFRKIKSILFIGAQYTGLSKATYSDIHNTYENAQPQFSQHRNRNGKTGVIALRADLEKNFKNNIKWETGISGTFADADGYSIIQNYSPENLFNSNYVYHENYVAAFTQLSGKLKNIDYSGGIRLESTDVKSIYQSTANASAIIKNKAQLFPRLKVTIPVDSSSSLTIAYSKSIYRPPYDNADQTSVYINPYFEWSNNINLDPSLSEDINATFQYKKYALTVALYQVRGPIYTDFNFDEQQTVLNRTEKNYDSERSIYVSATIPFRYRIWSSTNVMNLILKSIKDDQSVTGKSRPFVYYNSVNEFAFPHHFTFTISGWAVSKSQQGVISNNALFAVDTSLTKKINNLTCTLRFNNMFRSINGRESFTVNDVAASGIYHDNSREISLGVKYSIGKLKESRYKNREVDESGNRIR